MKKLFLSVLIAVFVLALACAGQKDHPISLDIDPAMEEGVVEKITVMCPMILHRLEPEVFGAVGVRDDGMNPGYAELLSGEIAVVVRHVGVDGIDHPVERAASDGKHRVVELQVHGLALLGKVERTDPGPLFGELHGCSNHVVVRPDEIPWPPVSAVECVDPVSYTHLTLPTN